MAVIFRGICVNAWIKLAGKSWAVLFRGSAASVQLPVARRLCIPSLSILVRSVLGLSPRILAAPN